MESMLLTPYDGAFLGPIAKVLGWIMDPELGPSTGPPGTSTSSSDKWGMGYPCGTSLRE